VAGFFGGTSLLILVGVMLDTMRQMETHLIQRHYDGFLRKGRIRGARDIRGRTGSANLLDDQTIVWMWAGLGILVIVGVSIYLATHI